MEDINNITVYREYKKLYDTETLIKKIIHIEFEISSDTESVEQNNHSEWSHYYE